MVWAVATTSSMNYSAWRPTLPPELKAEIRIKGSGESLARRGSPPWQELPQRSKEGSVGDEQSPFGIQAAKLRILVFPSFLLLRLIHRPEKA